MGKKSTPKTPDYMGTAQVQADASKDATLQQNYANRPTMTTPWGTQSWNTTAGTDPATGKPITNWSTEIQLSPEQQQALDSQMQIQQGRSDAANQMLGQVQSAFQTPIDYGSMPDRAGNVQGLNLSGQPLPDGTLPNQSFGQGVGGVTNSGAFNFGPVQTTLGDAGQIQDRLTSDPSGFRQQAQDAVWNLQKPMFEERRAALETQLSNQGLARGSEAWEREMRSAGDAEARAQLQAIDAGRVEANQMFGQDLASGQFANNAQGQRFGQNLAGGQFANAGQAQDAQQQMAVGAFDNAAQAQEFGQSQTVAGFENASAQQNFQNLMARAQQGDARAMMELQSQMAAGQFNNQNRAGAINEEQTRRSQPLNELNALLTGQQVQNPNMPNFTPSSQSQTPDLLGAQMSQYQADMNNASANTASVNSMIGNLGTAAAMAFIFSDARLKEDIQTLGVLSTGVRVVHYRYRGLPARFVGVVAQELATIQPEAVFLDRSGFLAVDYSKVRA